MRKAPQQISQPLKRLLPFAYDLHELLFRRTSYTSNNDILSSYGEFRVRFVCELGDGHAEVTTRQAHLRVVKFSFEVLVEGLVSEGREGREGRRRKGEKTWMLQGRE